MIITVPPTGDPATDTPALADAIQQLHAAGGGLLQLETGLYMVEKIAQLSCVEIKNVANIRIQGRGNNQTIVKLAPRNSLGDCHIFHVWRSSDISFADFQIDGSRFEHTLIDQQSHGVQVQESQNTTTEDISFYQLYGDGVRLLGESAIGGVWNENVYIRDNQFLENGRSGIAVQRGNRFVEISSNYFKDTSDQDIDFEPSGTANAPHDFRIVGNEIVHSTQTHSVTLTGFPSEAARNIIFANNIINNGTLLIGQVAGSLVSDNVIIGMPGTRQAVDVVSSVAGITISGNKIIACGGNEAAIRIAVQSGLSPSGVVISDNDIKCKVAINGILAYSADKVLVTGNRIEGFGSKDGVQVRVVDNKTFYGFLISGNAISNFARGAHFNVSAASGKISEIAFTGNVLFDDQATPTQITGLWNETPTKIDYLLTANNLFGRGIVNQII